MKQISSSKGDAAHFPFLGNPTFDIHLENNQSMTDFASIDELNEELKVRDLLHALQKTSNASRNQENTKWQQKI